MPYFPVYTVNHLLKLIYDSLWQNGNIRMKSMKRAIHVRQPRSKRHNGVEDVERDYMTGSCSLPEIRRRPARKPYILDQELVHLTVSTS